MPAEEFDPTEPELTAEGLLVPDDERFGPEDVAVVTGAASGSGQATAVALAANGLSVVGADTDEAGLDETVGLADDLGAAGDVVTVPPDLTNAADVGSMVEAAADVGHLRYVANVAGLQHIASIPAFPVEKYDLLLDVMLRAPFLTAKFAMPHVSETGDGVGATGNMSSVHGHYATQDTAAYITAKHGLHGLPRAIAAEGEGTLRGFSVGVGYVLTPLVANQIADTAAERHLRAGGRGRR